MSINTSEENWIESLRDLVEVNFRQEKKVAIRLQTLDILGEYVRQYQYIHEVCVRVQYRLCSELLYVIPSAISTELVGQRVVTGADRCSSKIDIFPSHPLIIDRCFPVETHSHLFVQSSLSTAAND